MLYNEFIEGTGCKDNDHNYKVYKDLEVMYMNSDLSKSEIYEYGKKLVDNSKSEAELKVEAEIKAEIEQIKQCIDFNKRCIEDCERSEKMWKDYGDADMARMSRGSKNYYKDENKRLRARIAALKWVLA